MKTAKNPVIIKIKERYLISWLDIKKIIFYFEIVNSLMPELETIRESMIENASNIDLVQFNNIMGIVGESINKIILLSALAIFGFYLLWCFFQSTSWR